MGKRIKPGIFKSLSDTHLSNKFTVTFFKCQLFIYLN